MLIAVNLMDVSLPFLPLSAFFPEFPIFDGIFSTQGVMVMLLAAYAVAMWMFLTSAPKVHTIMVSDLTIARDFYEGLLGLSVADVPLHYYYNYEQTLGATGIDPLYLSAPLGNTVTSKMQGTEGLWYQLMKNTQLHIIGGASYGSKDQERHVCFDKDCLEQILMRVQLRGVKHKIRSERPLNFLVKDLDDRVIEMTEVKN
ncbi:MAG TPA: glyoxalase-like domain protein [Planktothrix sp. UBA8407]|nr:glyoxalase-like domain protein [Planktothrix sp. UBA8402]HAO12985.1 glyoxalase-like domain protein [Planktothrix sp. UBA8407]HBK23654.1 glyoxalase-like domain protein [Planktothrix sp. UBA10369]